MLQPVAVGMDDAPAGRAEPGVEAEDDHGVTRRRAKEMAAAATLVTEAEYARRESDILRALDASARQISSFASRLRVFV
ncbi:hypothetical protein GCM10009102_33550 [Sphingomonas insulae]|uniref:Uncharacterized protein n=1 Tax=Sphingomonas insulae TaxID=424800 RepID=A0ABP3T9K9_9SPHN